MAHSGRGVRSMNMRQLGTEPNVLRLTLAVTVAPMLAVLCGCDAQTAPVSGTVTLRGRPVGPGTVIFLPTAGGARSAVGTFASDGRYQLSTFEPNDGALLGSHRVIIQARSPSESAFGDEEIVDSRIPLLYADPQASGVTARVKPGSNTIDFDLNDS